MIGPGTAKELSMKRTLAEWASVIGIVAAASLFCAYYLLLNMGTGSLTELAREQGKVLWGSASLVFNLAMAWCTLVSLVAIRQFSNSFRRGPRIAILLSFGLLFILLARFLGKFAGQPANELLDKFPAHKLEHVPDIVTVNSAAGVIVAILLALALVFLVRGVEKSSARSLADRIRWFNLLLYSGGVVLAAAIYTTYWLFQWAASLEGSAPVRKSQEIFASSVAVGGGLLFSSLLMLIVIPAAIRLNRQLQILMSKAAETDSDFNPQKWLVREGIETAPLRSLSAYVAVLLPAATGLLTKFPGF
jgi:magnesium-transporting ATPase (P-type)